MNKLNELGVPVTLDDFVRSEYFDAFTESKLGNDLFISDPERANRIDEAVGYGSDGSTHAERLQDMTEAVEAAHSDNLWQNNLIAIGFAEELAENIQDCIRDHILSEIREVEEYHEKEGTLHDVAG